MNTKTRVSTAVIGVVALVLLTAGSCEGESPAQKKGQEQTEIAFGKQSAAVPYPAEQLNDSLERRNVRERLLRYNNPSKISYIYLLSDTGSVLTYMTIKGKVTSNQSQLTTTDLIQYDSSGGNVTVPAPGDDGSYGDNEPGVFFFTTDGVLVTWNGRYLLSDAPLKVNPGALVLTYTDGSKPSSTAGK